MKRNQLVGMLGIFALVLYGCSTPAKSVPPKKRISNEAFIEKMIEGVNKNYPNNFVTDVSISDGEDGNWRGQVNIADFDNQTLVNVYFPHTGSDIKKKTNPWNETQEELANELAELADNYQNEGLSPSKLISTAYYRDEIQKVMTLNKFELERPLEIEFVFSLSDEKVHVQCQFQTKIKQKHLFVVLFDDKELTTIICETLKLSPIDGVEIHDLQDT